MPETVEELVEARGSSLMSIAMALAFVTGAAVATWYVFGDDLKAWSRQEHLAWDASGSTVLTLVSERRHSLSTSGGADQIVSEHYVWSLDTSENPPGQPMRWMQTLDRAELEVRAGEQVRFTAAWSSPPEAEGSEPRAGDAELPWTYRPGDLIDTPLAMARGEDGTFVSAAPAETLELLATRETGKQPPRRAELDEAQQEALQQELSRYGRQIATGLFPPLGNDARRPGQIWTTDLPLDTEYWGPHLAHYDLRLVGYEGDVAVVTAALTRPPSAVELGMNTHGLSSLKGTAQFRFDLVSRRPIAGDLHVELRGKIDGKFCTMTIDQAWALGDSPALEIPQQLRLPALPPPAEVPAAD